MKAKTDVVRWNHIPSLVFWALTCPSSTGGWHLTGLSTNVVNIGLSVEASSSLKRWVSGDGLPYVGLHDSLALFTSNVCKIISIF
jgi:hypothetical protein